MVDIAEVLTNGIAFDPKNWHRGGMNQLSHVPTAVDHLFDRIAAQKIPATLVGGVALLNYVSGRNTQDVDLIMAVEDAQTIAGLEVSERTEYFALAAFENLRVDLLLPSCALYRIVQQEYAQPLRYGTRTISTATVEGMIVLKLFALPSLYRQMQMTKVAIYEADLSALIGEHRPDTARLLDLVAAHVLPSDADELRKIVAEIEARLSGQRFQN